MGFDFPDLKGRGAISIDTETCDPNLLTMGPGYIKGRDGYIAGISMATDDGWSAYIPVAHEAGHNEDKTKVYKWLKKQMSLPVPKVGMNLLYDMGYLDAVGIKMEGPLYDVGIAEPLLNENRFKYDLDTIGKAHIGIGKNEDQLKQFIVDKFGKQKKAEWKSNIWRCPSDVVATYAIPDATMPLEIFKVQQKQLEEQGLWDLFIMESRLTPMMLDMRKRGVRVDLDHVERILKDFEARKEIEMNALYKMAKQEISIWGPDDLAILFDNAGVEYPMTPKTKKPSITKLFLKNCEHPVALRLMEARALDKLCSGFLRGAILENNVNGRIHCTFNQLRSDDGGTVSGRFSCVAPWTPINTSKGIKRIDNVAVGDWVYTHKNRWKPVTHTWIKGVEPMYDVYLSNGNVLTCTKKHRLLLEDGSWKTVGDILEHFEGMDVAEAQQGSDASDVQVTQHADDQGDRREAANDTAQHSTRHQRRHDEGRTESPERPAVLGRKAGAEEPDVWKDGGAASRLEGPVRGSEGILDREAQRYPRLRSSYRGDGSTGHLEASKEHGSAPHRREWPEQQLGQSRTGDEERPHGNSQSSAQGQQGTAITKIEARGSHEVHDITVADDESYSACGVFSHNSSLPNLQQIPTRTADGLLIRQAFIPDEGQEWWCYDYSQIEYRLMVNDAVTFGLKGAKEVAEQYEKDPRTDFHKVVAEMAGIDRDSAKTINFGIAYGEGIPKLIKALNLTEEEGEEFMRNYHRNAPFMKPLAQGFINMASQKGEIRTLMKRKRRYDTWEISKYRNGVRLSEYFPHRVPGSRRAFTHAALNARIQGSAADLMKKAMLDIYESGVCDVIGVPQLTVHDELDGSKPKTKKAQKAYEEVGNIMRKVMKLHVPLLVDGGTGANWRAAKGK